jgi:hypothetical protein
MILSAGGRYRLLHIPVGGEAGGRELTAGLAWHDSSRTPEGWRQARRRWRDVLSTVM